jgi:ribokinase
VTQDRPAARRPVEEAVVFAVGSINVDVEMQLGSPSGTTVQLARRSLVSSGGKAANVATLARRWGAPAELAGCVGRDELAGLAVRGPERAGVEVSGVVSSPDHPTAVSTIWLEESGDKRIGLATGANDHWPEGSAERIEGVVGALAEGSIVVVDLEADSAVVAAAVHAASRRGLTVVVDPSPPARLDDELLASATHLVPDDREAAVVAGRDVRIAEDALDAAEHLRERGATYVHVKLADGGAVLAGPDGRWHLVAPRVEPVDATGAGDAYAAAVAWCLRDGGDAVAAATAGVAAATCAVGVFGSHEVVPTVDDLRRTMGRVRVESMPEEPHRG